MKTLTIRVHEALSAIAPIIGVCVVKPSDKATWVVDFSPEATEQERAAAKAALVTFDVEKENARLDVPQEVWAGAMMRALNTLGILEQIDQIVTAEGDLLAKKLWDRAAAFRRDDPMISVIGGKAGWSESDLDDLFRLAGSFNK